MMQKNQEYVLEYCKYEFPPDLPIVGLTGDAWPLPDGEITFLHCHNCLEIGVCHEGSGRLVVEGKTWSFHAQDITLVCPNTMHISKSDPGTTSSWEYIYVDVEKLIRSYFPGYLSNAALLSFDDPAFQNVISAEEEPELYHTLLQLLAELHNKEENYQIKSICLCVSFLASLLRRLSSEDAVAHGASASRMIIYAAIDYVEHNYMNKIRIADMANACNLSLTHFRRIFGSIMGESPLNYVERIRVNKSCDLLYSTEYSVLDIALRVGFSSNNSYNRNFKKYMDMTPLQWRKRSRSVNRNSICLHF